MCAGRELAPGGVPERQVATSTRTEGDIERARRDLQPGDGVQYVTVKNVQRTHELAPLPVANDHGRREHLRAESREGPTDVHLRCFEHHDGAAVRTCHEPGVPLRVPRGTVSVDDDRVRRDVQFVHDGGTSGKRRDGSAEREARRARRTSLGGHADSERAVPSHAGRAVRALERLRRALGELRQSSRGVDDRGAEPDQGIEDIRRSCRHVHDRAEQRTMSRDIRRGRDRDGCAVVRSEHEIPGAPGRIRSLPRHREQFDAAARIRPAGRRAVCHSL